MQNLNRLLQIANAASVIGDLARQKQRYVLPVMHTTGTFYLHADDAAVRIVRWDQQQVEATIETRPPIGWRIATDYDENGVYVVVMKRMGLGQIAKATISVMVPRDAHLVLRLAGGLVTLDHVHGTLQIPPVHTNSPPPALPDEV